MTIAVTYAVALAIFVAIDMLWLGWIAKGYYQAELGAMLAPTANLAAAIAFYLIYTAGLMVFVIVPSSEAGGWPQGPWMGALFGFVAYATYDLSNLATLKGWSLNLSLLDMAWGAALTGVTSASTIAISERVLR
jgi:uncharacterized membrane protein